MIITNQPTQPKLEQDKLKKIDSKEGSQSSSANASGAKNIFKSISENIEISQIDQKLNQLTNKLLDAIKANNEQSGNGFKALTQMQNSQVAPNLAGDVKKLISELQKDPKLIKFAEKLSEFTKPVENMKPGNIAQNIKDSGIMLEAKLAQSLEPNALPEKIKNLLSAMKNVSSNELKQSFLSLPNDDDAQTNFKDLNKLLTLELSKSQESLKNSPFSTILKLADKLENTIKFFDKLSTQIQNNPKEITQTEQKTQKLLNQLEKNLDELTKNINSLDLTKPNVADAKIARNQLNSVINELKNQIIDIKNQSPQNVANVQNNQTTNTQKNVNLEQITAQNQTNQGANSNVNSQINLSEQNATNLNQSMNSQANSITNQSLNSQVNPRINQSVNSQANSGVNQGANSQINLSEQNQITPEQDNETAKQNAQNSKETSTNQATNSQNKTSQLSSIIGKFSLSINTDANSNNIQNKLNLITNKVANMINSLDPSASAAKITLSEIKNLLNSAKAAQSEISQITTNNENNSAKNIQNDLKSVLLGLKDATEGSAQNQGVNQTASRLITQIEINQLMSYAQNSLQTHLPYTWDELESSSMAFKHGQKNKFYARIELNFHKFGSISVILGLFDGKYLDVSIMTGEEEFKNRVMSSSSELKQALSAQGLIINSFFLAQKAQNEPYSSSGAEAVDLGYNVKV